MIEEITHLQSIESWKLNQEMITESDGTENEDRYKTEQMILLEEVNERHVEQSKIIRSWLRWHTIRISA